jgi:hypothetical protein
MHLWGAWEEEARHVARPEEAMNASRRDIEPGVGGRPKTIDRLPAHGGRPIFTLRADMKQVIQHMKGDKVRKHQKGEVEVAVFRAVSESARPKKRLPQLAKTIIRRKAKGTTW